MHRSFDHSHSHHLFSSIFSIILNIHVTFILYYHPFSISQFIFFAFTSLSLLIFHFPRLRSTKKTTKCTWRLRPPCRLQPSSLFGLFRNLQCCAPPGIKCLQIDFQWNFVFTNIQGTSNVYEYIFEYEMLIIVHWSSYHNSVELGNVSQPPDGQR